MNGVFISGTRLLCSIPHSPYSNNKQNMFVFDYDLSHTYLMLQFYIIKCLFFHAFKNPCQFFSKHTHKMHPPKDGSFALTVKYTQLVMSVNVNRNVRSEKRWQQHTTNTIQPSLPRPYVFKNTLGRNYLNSG